MFQNKKSKAHCETVKFTNCTTKKICWLIPSYQSDTPISLLGMFSYLKIGKMTRSQMLPSSFKHLIHFTVTRGLEKSISTYLKSSQNPQTWKVKKELSTNHLKPKSTKEPLSAMFSTDEK